MLQPTGKAVASQSETTPGRAWRRMAAIALTVAWLGAACGPSETRSEQAPVTEPAESEHFTILPDQITWVSPPPEAGFLPPGVQIALLEGGSPLDKGPFTFRLKFPPGSRLMPHTHPTTDRITVVSGTLHQGMGRVFDQDNAETVPAGGFIYHAANIPHYVWVDQETVLQFSGTGPFGLTYVNPADDPRTKR
ncbi:MAG TPA: cupin domain-containing protein [Actinomycetota bacterium]